MNSWVAIPSTGDRRGRALRLARAHDAVLLVCDADGTLLWIDGDEQMLHDATGVHLMRGARWSEADAGTNAMGTALAVDHSLQVFSAEHFATPVHGWTCSAAPLHDPVSGQLLGVLDLSGPLQTAHPHSLALVTAAARMVEAVLLREAAGRAAREAEQARTSALAPRPRAVAAGVALRVLGRDRAEVDLGGRTVTLSRRHSELMALLALRPEGMSAEEIAIATHGDFGKPVTARAELSRLRRILGPRLLAEPYRLDTAPQADFLMAGALAGAGALHAALDAYPGPLLPRSELPLVVEARESLDHRMRSAILRSGTADLLHRWVHSAAGRDDLQACRLLVATLPEDDDRRPAALSHLRRLVLTD